MTGIGEAKATHEESEGNDLRLVLTEAGFAWRTDEHTNEEICTFCRAGTPIALQSALDASESTPAKLCLLDTLALKNDLKGLLSHVFDADESVRDRATALSGILLKPTDHHIVYGLITHPDARISGQGLELAGRAQLNAFMPELSNAARSSKGPRRDGARVGIAHLDSLGGHALAEEFGILKAGPPNPPVPKPPEGHCPGLAKWTVSTNSHAITSLALGGFERGLNGDDGLPENSPALLGFALRAGLAAGKGDRESLERAHLLLSMVMTRESNCITHICDLRLLEKIEGAMLSAKGADTGQ